MARTGRRRRNVPAADLTGAIERLAVQIGDRIGAGIARALIEGAAAAPQPPRPARTCAQAGCDRAVAAKGLCKSHYNLMLYHRRKGH